MFTHTDSVCVWGGHPDQGALWVEGVQSWRSARREGVLAKPTVHWSSVAWETGAWL